jgi:hypothetical protein
MNTVDIIWSEVGYGSLGLGGNLGYDTKRVKPPHGFGGWQFISAHAPSRILVKVNKPIYLAGFFDVLPASIVLKNTASFYASGNLVGRVSEKEATTLSKYGHFLLWSDEHLLEIRLSTEDKSSCHTVWAYKDANQN